MSPARRLAPLLLAALAALLSACTVAGTRRTVDASGWETAKTYECDWQRDGSWLRKRETVNSPVLPFIRTHTIMVIYGLPLVLDLVASPFAYYFDRHCWVTDTQTAFVGTPEQRQQQAQAQARQERERREAESAEGRKRRADEQQRLARRREEDERRAAEQRELERLYPPLPKPPAAAARRPDDYALIVGIESYRSLPKATYAEGDARTVRDYLQSLGVPPQNEILLTGEGASRADVAKYLEEWLPGVVKPDSRVYFYYSGHGAPDPTTGTAYLVPWDGDASFLKSTALPLAKLYADLAALPNKESVVMLDACFSGAGGRSVLADGVRPLVLLEDTTQPPEKAAVLAASGAREIAGGLDLRRQGLFTYFLLRGLAGEADAARTGHLTVGDLNSYVRQRVSETARRANRDQHPRLLGDPSLRLY